MPLPEEFALRGPADAREIVAEACFPTCDDGPLAGGVGVEVECFPIRLGIGWGPAGRLSMRAVTAVLAEVDAPFGQFTVEPGAQLEHSTAVHPTASGAVRELERGLRTLGNVLPNAVLAGAGLDVWHELESVPMQLDQPRYQAMAAFFGGRGDAAVHGRTMMCHTCSLQVNLDLGPPAVAVERWLVANLVTPLVTATFASSPVHGAVCGRALTWMRLDPTRTGVPRLLVLGVEDPVRQMTDLALRADVLLVRRADRTVAGTPGWTFGDWLRDGHPTHGRPTAEDLRYHLTTLFPEVRPRGFLEIRSTDSLPPRWQAVPVTLLAGLLYDDRARGQVLAILERHRARLPALARRAAVAGVADPVLCALAVETWSLALAGARRLPTGFVAGVDLGRCEDFLERFTLRGRCPSDELRERLATSAASALAWASEPVEEYSLC